MQPIDFVYLWCDGSDPNFIYEKNFRLKNLNLQPSSDNVDELRYFQFNELKYSLRSIHTYAPWFRYIFIVTNKQRPAWLKDHEKIKIIDHAEIIPPEIYPTYSSICIEMYLDKIPGLAENFIYTNDDVLINRKLEPQDFFSKNGKPIVWLHKVSAITPRLSHIEHQLQDNLDTSWNQTIQRAWILFCKKNNTLVPLDSPAHSMDAYNLSMFKSIKEKYPEILQLNSSPIRTGHGVSRILFSYEMAHLHKCELHFNPKSNFINRLLFRLLPSDTYAVVRSNPSKLERDIRIMNPKTFCINNLTIKDSAKAVSLLEKMYPKPAPWEI